VQVLSEKLKSTPVDAPDAAVEALLAATFEETNTKLSKTEIPPHQGCTAVACLVRGTKDSRRLFAANAGDARAVVW
jgi:serine/threonine protein phosphatase PrpC